MLKEKSSFHVYTIKKWKYTINICLKGHSGKTLITPWLMKTFSKQHDEKNRCFIYSFSIKKQGQGVPGGAYVTFLWVL